MKGGNLDNAYSFNLMGHESLIMEQTAIGEISRHQGLPALRQVQAGVLTHVPRANLLYSPRNKILSTSLLIEAFLYEEQTRRGVSLAHWAEFEDVADHCTVCHKCESPARSTSTSATCRSRCATCCASRAKSFNPGKAAAMAFLRQGPGHHQADPGRHDRLGLQGPAPRPPHRQASG
jgi:hypothetical protein